MDCERVPEVPKATWKIASYDALGTCSVGKSAHTVREYLF